MEGPGPSGAYVELAPGLLRVPTVPCSALNSFLVLEDDGSVTLIDAGFRSGPKRIRAALAELGRRPSDVGRILLTHAHYDHAGGAREMKLATGSGVQVHEADAGYLQEGRPPSSDAANPLGRLLTHLSFGRYPRLEVEERMHDGQLLDVGGGLRVIHTPGHTPGHVSFLHERSGTLITGDAIFNILGMTFSPPFFCNHLRLSRETAGRLGDLDFEVAAFTHGREIRHHARARIRAFLSRKGVLRS